MVVGLAFASFELKEEGVSSDVNWIRFGEYFVL